MRTCLRLTLFIILSIVAVFIVLVLLVGRNTPTSAQSYTVEYRIDDNAAYADLTFTNASGATEQHERVKLPFSFTFSAQPGQFVYIAAQNSGEVGKVICHILVNGTEVQNATSSGAYAIATCHGKL